MRAKNEREVKAVRSHPVTMHVSERATSEAWNNFQVVTKGDAPAWA